MRFPDGSAKRSDTVIAAAGCAVHLPFLDPSLRPLEGRKLELFLRVGHRTIKPIPQPGDLSRNYWERAATGPLLLRRCTEGVEDSTLSTASLRQLLFHQH